MSFIPKFSIYNEANDTEIYEIENVLFTTWPNEQSSFVEITNLRSAGAIVIPGGNKSYDIEIRAILIANNYTDLTTKIFTLKNTIALNTKYVLRVDKSQSTYDTINVMRLEAIVFENSKRNNVQRFTLRLKGNIWV